jgi:hypothetical protein
MGKIEKIEKLLKNYFFNEKVEIKNLEYIDNHYTVIFKIKLIVTLFVTIDNDNIDLSFIDINFNNYYTIDDIIELSNKLKDIENILNK